MRGYKFVLFQAVYSYDKFSHNNQREIIIRAKNEEEARSKLDFRKGYTIFDHIVVKDEMIYSIQDLERGAESSVGNMIRGAYGTHV